MWLSSISTILFQSILPFSSAALQCDVQSIQAVLPSNATVVYALPQASIATFGSQSDIAYPTNATGLPAFCAVLVNVTSSPTSSFMFGLGLPEEWNQRYLAVGEYRSPWKMTNKLAHHLLQAMAASLEVSTGSTSVLDFNMVSPR